MRAGTLRLQDEQCGKKFKSAHLAGPNATIQNTPPLVTSNKARTKHGLSLLTDMEGNVARFDVLRPQKLAARRQSMSSSSARIRSSPTRPNFTRRPTDT